MKWFVTGPTDKNIKKLDYLNECNVIILGDVGLDKETNMKFMKKKKNIVFYIVAGAKEKDPENNIELTTFCDAEVDGMVYIDPKYNNIRYLGNGQIYRINGNKVLCLGGGTPVNTRRFFASGNKWYGTSALSKEKREYISKLIAGVNVDYVLSYCAPYSWEPVPKGEDPSIELWLDLLKSQFGWKNWWFSKFRRDVLFSDSVSEIYKSIIEIKKSEN